MATTERVSLHDLLRVARPRECNTQQTTPIHATARATVTQHGSLKALARAALERNSPRNNSATAVPKTAQQHPFSGTPVVARQPTPLRVACVASPRGATAQQPEPVTRTVVRFRLVGSCPRSWCSAIGTKPRAEVIADLQAIHGDALAEVLP